ncbi:MAG: hypothetical protein B7Y02_11835 [Rhodobacterales bacterium 17-64-5]|nr:MAG: hypothetical protein B7Y02_11835 [Rhodobacterales bacterium 17-64-5]
MSKKPEFKDQNIIVGVDDGFAMTKLVVMQGGSIIKQLMIPSRARSGIHGTTSIGAAAQGEIEARYETEGNTFTVQDLSDAESARFDEYPFSPMNRAIITHALRVAGLGGKEVTVATGLPLSMYYRGSEADEAVLTRNPQVDFLYYSNDMIGAGGLLYCLHKGLDVPGQIGLAGFNGVELLDGLPIRLATMDACRLQIGRVAAEIIAGKHSSGTIGGEVIELFPTLQKGDTIRG